MRQLFSLAILLFAAGCVSVNPVKQTADRVFEEAVTQFTALDARLSPEQMPITFEDGRAKDGPLNEWTSGFFPGSLWLVYEYTGKPEILEMAKRQTAKLDGIIGMDTHHDIGFQVNSSFGNGYRLTGDPAYLEMMKAGAEKLSTRFSPVVGCTRSWNPGKRWNYPVIIDNMMNLEILTKVSALMGEEKYLDIARTHANTTMKNHFRPDASTWHVVAYDEETGAVEKKQTSQGFSDESTWSRGEAWALYGFTMMYRETKDPAYLEQARKVAEYLIPMLPKDGVPEWDFNAPGTRHAFDMNAVGAPDASVYKWRPGDPVLRDSSAGAIIASALAELASYTSGKESKRYRKTALKIVGTLASPEYLAAPGENGGFLLKHGVTNLHKWSGVDIPLTYADYYFLEAIQKLLKLEN
ncbi:MAG: glycoside hydrolase family 88 protein [Bacteroidales bacterium]|nr:glycoside hydrolase family 88 protein [Bacteroidales bacterium]